MADLDLDYIVSIILCFKIIQNITFNILLLIFIVSKAIVDLHESRISVTSQGEGFGTTFTLDIPVLDETGLCYYNDFLNSNPSDIIPSIELSLILHENINNVSFETNDNIDTNIINVDCYTIDIDAAKRDTNDTDNNTKFEVISPR